ncbi:hypothetical protein CH063_01215 [Colletotrichum higginsianum]|uniref:Uncharacterized protein n=1 Tax=Colletotrichum higginsianum (strain IMI 349063) TaxID=759273 RepID=H1V3T0_COLHI|nr:uncharacterized protein CH63R_09997 [Colletotrichum higginsianum IMI 349063]OBR05877.1 hypothetical protein CH63R_09997 [Colletotrichum higginsianum IMI 349063]CCF34882.1 hypothetical protein CH063_01215 [Colletotrichum higginsianum]
MSCAPAVVSRKEQTKSKTHHLLIGPGWGFAILHALGHDSRIPLAVPVTRKKQRPAGLGLMMPGHLGDRVRLALRRRHPRWTVDERKGKRGERTCY